MNLFSIALRRIYRVLALVLAVHFLNISMDSKDSDPDSIPEDLSVNDIESISEFIAELVLGWQDAFSEHEEADNEGSGSPDYYKYYFSNQLFVTSGASWMDASGTKFLLKNSVRFDSLSRDITAPPPKA